MGQSPSLPFSVTAQADGKSVAIKLVLPVDGEYGNVIEMAATDDRGGVVSLSKFSAAQRNKMHRRRAYLLKLPGNTSHVNVSVKLKASELAASALVNPEVLDESFATRIRVSGS